MLLRQDLSVYTDVGEKVFFKKRQKEAITRRLDSQSGNLRKIQNNVSVESHDR